MRCALVEDDGNGLDKAVLQERPYQTVVGALVDTVLKDCKASLTCHTDYRERRALFPDVLDPKTGI